MRDNRVCGFRTEEKNANTPEVNLCGKCLCLYFDPVLHCGFCCVGIIMKLNGPQCISYTCIYFTMQYLIKHQATERLLLFSKLLVCSQTYHKALSFLLMHFQKLVSSKNCTITLFFFAIRPCDASCWHKATDITALIT